MRLSTIGMMLMLVSSAASAAGLQVDATVRAKIEKFLSPTGSGRVIQYFPGPEGLIGAAVAGADGTNNIVVYATPTGEHIFSGVLINTVTAKDEREDGRKWMPKPDQSALVKELRELPAINGSKGKDVVYALIDPQCHFCKAEFAELKDSSLEVHWIPVGVLGPASINVANSLHEKDSIDELAAWFDTQKIDQNSSTSGKGESATRKAKEFMDRHNIQGVPYLVVVRGGDVQIHHGFVKLEKL